MGDHHLGAQRGHGPSSSAAAQTASSVPPPEASVAATTAPSTMGALQMRTLAPRSPSQHLDRHLGVHLGPAEIDQHRDPGLVPDALDGGPDLDRIGAELAHGVAAGPGAGHLVADHLAHHVGSTLGHLGRVRDDDHAHGHAGTSSTSQTAWIRRQEEVAPGS